jgi:hypothetical protein
LTLHEYNHNIVVVVVVVVLGTAERLAYSGCSNGSTSARALTPTGRPSRTALTTTIEGAARDAAEAEAGDVVGVHNKAVAAVAVEVVSGAVEVVVDTVAVAVEGTVAEEEEVVDMMAASSSSSRHPTWSTTTGIGTEEKRNKQKQR